jgi:carboxylesterase type B
MLISFTDKTLFSDTRARASAGNFLKVPLLQGTNQHENDVFVVGQEIILKGFATPVLTELLSDIATAVSQIILFRCSWLTLLSSQIVFTCPAAVVAADRLKAKVPAWRYQYQGRSTSP